MISVVVLTKNEEDNIKDCINRLRWAEEIIVIDDNSEDKTIEVAKNAGAKVFIHSLNGDFSAQRNFGLEKASGDWVLFVDADERVSLELKDEILASIRNFSNIYNGFFLKRKDFMWGKELKYGEFLNLKLLRLVKKGTEEWVGKVHEKWIVKGKIGEFRNPLFHYPHQSITEFLKEINFYTDIRSKELYEQGKNCSWASIVLYPFGKFILNYCLRLGIKDGIRGLIVTLLMSFHSFLVRGKLWLMWNKK